MTRQMTSLHWQFAESPSKIFFVSLKLVLPSRE